MATQMFISPDDTLHSQQHGTCFQCPLEILRSRHSPPKACPTAVQVVWLEHMRERVCESTSSTLPYSQRHYTSLPSDHGGGPSR